MATATFPTTGGWIPIESSAEVIQKVKAASAIEAFGHHVPMGSETKMTPRSGGVVIQRWAKGASAPADGSANDDVLLAADKVGGKVTVAEEDREDSLADIVKSKSLDAATSYARLYDNSSLGVTAAKGTSGWKYDSLYYALTQAEPTTGYVANSNLTIAGTGGITYDLLSDAFSLYETGDFFSEEDTVVIAHASFKNVLRKIKDGDGAPIFNESSNGTAGGGQGGGLRLFGYPLQWSAGAKTSAAGTATPTGRPLLVVGNRQYLLVGDRVPLGVNYQPAETGIGVDTDESVLYFRARKSFAAGAPGAFSMVVG